MKIVFIGQKGIPPKSGGVEKHVSDLAIKLVSLGHEVLVYTRANYSDPDLLEYRGVKLVNLPSVSSKNLDAISHTFLACLDLIFKRRKADIIHFHSIGPSSLIWLVKLFKPRTPIVSTFHTQCYKHKKWGAFARTYLKFGEYMCCKLSLIVIVVSKNLKRYADKKYKINTVNIPNGVNMPNVKKPKLIQEKWGLSENSYILLVTRLIRHKGAHYLIDAYKQLITDKKLVIVGGGSYTDTYVSELRELAEGNENIILTGQQSGEKLEELYSNAYLFVQPSESEGLSIALLEAMSYKNAVLVSDIPENIEAVEDKGFIFKDRDASDLKNQLEKLLANPESVSKYAKKARVHVDKTYNWNEIVKDIELLYRKILDQ